MLKLTRRGWLGSLVAALAAALVPLRARALPASPPPPRRRKRWIGHY